MRDRPGKRPVLTVSKPDLPFPMRYRAAQSVQGQIGGIARTACKYHFSKLDTHPPGIDRLGWPSAIPLTMGQRSGYAHDQTTVELLLLSAALRNEAEAHDLSPLPASNL